MSVEISPETEGRLIAEAMRQNISVEMLLKRIMDEGEIKAPAAPKGSAPELPIFHLGAVGSLRRSEIYGDVD
jgi:hypothetical protein